MRKLLIHLALGIPLLTLVACEAPSVGYNDGYMPEQPIPYDHALHAGTYKIPCLYCHAHVDKGRHASVPSLNICMNCHKSVATDKPLIKQLADAYNKGESIPWVRVHMLPDFAHFNHAPHIMKLSQINAKKRGAAVTDYQDATNITNEDRQAACYTCHGRIDQMTKVYQVEDLSMGWCVQCHRKPEHNAPVNCSTCHY
tara:strand:+ start:1542 stop:2135 length:594 start_codon:yes stop_codon:yes gene_type:complete